LFWLSVAPPQFGRGRARIITKKDYARTLRDWDREGPGYVLLYNIELQSFENTSEIQRTWGGIAQLSNIKGVVLLLPPSKVNRWEHVVMREQDGFFKNPENHKFEVCKIQEPSGDDNRVVPPGVGFALYRLGDTPGQGPLHKEVIVFVLSEPFSQEKPAYVVGDAAWWDYHHILKFRGDREILTSAEHTWLRTYVESGRRDIQRVQADVQSLKPMKPEDFLTKLGTGEARKAEILSHFKPRRRIQVDPSRIPGDMESGAFSIVYDNQECIQGNYTGVEVKSPDDKSPGVKEPIRKPAMIWVGGFTERRAAKLPGIFERFLKRKPSPQVVQFYYEVSPPISYVTLSRYMQDMREVLRFVNKQSHVIVPNELVIIARSINGLLAALVAEEEEFLAMLRGVILVAPVFDVIQMIDNYRAVRGQAHVTVEKGWRMCPGYTADRWENPQDHWLEFFGYDVSLSVIADIVQHDRNRFSLEAFKHAVGRISQRCPVYVLTHSEDPITGSKEAIRSLEHASGGTGLILEENFKLVRIKSSHIPEISRDQYPFVLKPELPETKKSLQEILQKLGVPPAQEPEPGPTVEDHAESVLELLQRQGTTMSPQAETSLRGIMRRVPQDCLRQLEEAFRPGNVS